MDNLSFQCIFPEINDLGQETAGVAAGQACIAQICVIEKCATSHHGMLPKGRAGAPPGGCQSVLHQQSML